MVAITIRAVSVIASVALITGCASHSGEAQSSHAAESVEMAPSDACPPSLLANLKEQELVFQSSGEDSAGRLRKTIRPLAGASGWVVTREVSSQKEKGASWREQTYVVLEDGSVALKRELNKDDSVIVEFEPPMVVYPASLAPSAKDTPGFTQSFHVTVHPMDNEKKIKVQGPGTQEISYISVATGTLEGKPVVAARIRSVFVSDFGGPKTRNETSQWLVRNQGVVQETRVETTKVVGVQIRENKEAWVLPSLKLK